MSEPADTTPFGRDGDHCPYCGHDWRQPHDRDCPSFRKCQYPPGCEHDSAPGKRLCRPHYDAVYALLGPKDKEKNPCPITE